jgi:hypothetical protein
LPGTATVRSRPSRRHSGYSSGRYLIGLPPSALSEHTEVAILVDEGPLYFNLRGVRVRGRVSRVHENGDGFEWFEVKPDRDVAWHYGKLRER